MARVRTSSSLELLVSLDRAAAPPLHRQLERQLRDGVRSGRLGPDLTLPSTRALAEQLGVSRGLVVEAYEQLAAEGYLATRPGGGTRVASTVAVPASRRTDPPEPRFTFDFRPGRPDPDAFPRAAWLRSVRSVLASAPGHRFGYHDGRGLPELREALARYLNRVRGTAAGPADIIICNGFAQGLRLVTRALREAGIRRIGIEDPSDPEYRARVEAEGVETIGIPVDGSGMRVELLDAAGLRAVVLTPAHQYPTGAVLAPDRRAALVAWAAEHDGLIVEDDYDAEFRYDRQPIGTLQGLSPDRVAYAGTASKVLAPGLRLGWLILPPRILDPVAHAKRAEDHGSPTLDQLAFADFIERGALDRHLRRMRTVYRGRRDALLDALRRHLPAVKPAGASAGLHVLARLPPELDERAILGAAGRAGIGVVGLGASPVASRGTGGIIFGYGAIDEARIGPGIRALAAAIGGQPGPLESVQPEQTDVVT